MIILTSINGCEFCLNSELIYKIEEAPDTKITLNDGKILRVANDTDEIIQKIVKFKREIHDSVWRNIDEKE